MKINLKSKSANSQVIYNVSGTVARTGIGMLSMPVFTRLLGAEQYGKAALFSSWMSIIFILMGFDSISCFAPGMYKYKDSYKQFRFSVLMFGIVFSCAVVLLSIVFVAPLSRFMQFPAHIVILAFLSAFALYIVEYVCAVWIYEKKAACNLLVSLFYVGTSFLLSFFLVKCWKGENKTIYIGRALGQAIPEIILALVLLIYMFRQKSVFFVKEYWKYAAVYGSSIIIHHMANRILTQSDRIMMEHMNTSGVQIGIYSFFINFVGILDSIHAALCNAYVPFCYEDLEQKNYKVLNERMKNYIEIFTVLACGFLMLSYEVMKVFSGDEYWSGVNVIPLLVVSSYAMFGCTFSLNYEAYNNKPKYTAFGSVFAAVMNIVLNFLLIPISGIYGAALATAISYIFRAGIHMLIVAKWKLQKSPFEVRPLMIGFSVTLFFCLLFYVLRTVWMVRWGLGAMLAVYLVLKIYKRKVIF